MILGVVEDLPWRESGAVMGQAISVGSVTRGRDTAAQRYCFWHRQRQKSGKMHSL